MNSKDVLTALDMVHAAMWHKLEKMQDTQAKSLIVSETEIRCEMLLIEAAMRDAGDKRQFRPSPGSEARNAQA